MTNGKVKAEKEATKLLGAHVNLDTYWAFKNASAARKETMQDAILHAAIMYIEAGKEAKDNG